MKFTLTIELGEFGTDESMTFDDIESALIGVKFDMRCLAEEDCTPSPDNFEGVILDNSELPIGKWEVTK